MASLKLVCIIIQRKVVWIHLIRCVLIRHATPLPKDGLLRFLWFFEYSRGQFLNCPQHSVTWSQGTCSNPHSTGHRMGKCNMSNGDTHLYPPRNSSSVHLTATQVQRDGLITDGMWSGWTTLRDAVIS